MKFEKGKEYTLRYSMIEPSRRWRGTNIPTEYNETKYFGSYEYIGNMGSKLHFYDNNSGIDVFLSKKQAIESLQNTDITNT